MSMLKQAPEHLRIFDATSYWALPEHSRSVLTGLFSRRQRTPSLAEARKETQYSGSCEWSFRGVLLAANVLRRNTKKSKYHNRETSYSLPDLPVP